MTNTNTVEDIVINIAKIIYNNITATSVANADNLNAMFINIQNQCK